MDSVATFDRAVLQQLEHDVQELKREALAVFRSLVLPTFGSTEWQSFPQTLYGYMHRAFAFVDLLSCYWRFPESRSDQTLRMVDFLATYSDYSRDAISAAVQIWRHKLAHTARPRALTEVGTGRTVYWLLHWHEPHIPKAMHFTWAEGADSRILNLGAIFLIEDVQRALARFVADVESSSAMQATVARFHAELGSAPFRDVDRRSKTGAS